MQRLLANEFVAADLTPSFAVHAWLCVFLTGVGALKASGRLPHKNSRLVGVLELLAGAIFLPGWPALAEWLQANPYNLYMMGASMTMTALGIVTGDRKKLLSPVCWFHAFLTVGFCISLELDDIQIQGYDVNPALLVPLFMLYGHFVGRNLGTEPDPSSQTTKVKEN